MSRDDYIKALIEGKRVEYNDAWVGWTVALHHTVKTAPLELLRIVGKP